jgi:hypothetical protein
MTTSLSWPVIVSGAGAAHRRLSLDLAVQISPP